MFIWNAKEVAEATNGKTTGSFNVSEVSIDSRTIAKDSLFIAIKGEKFDGHDFVKECLEKGASGALVHKEIQGVDKAKLIIVDDTTKALWRLGEFSRKRTKAKIVGVTGSVGKTGTKEAIKLALSGQGKTYATIGNLNNHFGAPLSLSRMAADMDYGVFEMGMNHANEISLLTGLIKPNVSVITTVEAVHLENFESVEGIAYAKSEIFQGMAAGGTAVINLDNKYLNIMKSEAEKYKQKVITFGENEKADFRLISYSNTENGIKVEASVKGKKINYELSVSGKHWAINSLIVLAVVDALNLNIEKAAKDLGAYQVAKGRGQFTKIKVNGGEATLIDDAYNASPASMAAAFEVLEKYRNPKGRTVAILGDMRELGPLSPEFHKGLAEPLALRNVDVVYTCGELMNNLFNALPKTRQGIHKKDSEELSKVIFDYIKAGDVILVKGSNGSKMIKVIEALTAKK